MAAWSSLFCNGHDAVLRARNGPSYEQKVPLRIHFDDPKAQLRMPFRTHMARHPLALDDARRIGTRADGAGLPVPCVAVRCRTTTEAVAMHHALETSALRSTGDLHQLTRCENVHFDLG